MAIAYDNATVNLSVGSNTNSFSHTCTGSNGILFLGIFSTVGDDLTGITYNGVSMTQLAKQANGTEELYLYYLLNPATGANTLTATFSVSVISRAHAASYTGARQSGVPDASTSATSTNGATGTITTIADNAWSVLMARGSGTVAAGAGSTERPSAAASTSAIFDSNGPKTPAGSTSMTWTDTGAGTYIMASFAPFVAAVVTSVNRNLNLLGVGQ